MSFPWICLQEVSLLIFQSKDIFRNCLTILQENWKVLFDVGLLPTNVSKVVSAGCLKHGLQKHLMFELLQRCLFCAFYTKYASF